MPVALRRAIPSLLIFVVGMSLLYYFYFVAGKGPLSIPTVAKYAKSNHTKIYVYRSPKALTTIAKILANAKKVAAPPPSMTVVSSPFWFITLKDGSHLFIEIIARHKNSQHDVVEIQKGLYATTFLSSKKLSSLMLAPQKLLGPYSSTEPYTGKQQL